MGSGYFCCPSVITVTLFTPQSALVLILHYIDVLTFNHLILLSLRACVLCRFSQVQLFATLWTVPIRLLCLWGSPGKNSGVDCHVLLQGIFPTEGLNQHLLRSPELAGGSLLLAPPEKTLIHQITKLTEVCKKLLVNGGIGYR